MRARIDSAVASMNKSTAEERCAVSLEARKEQVMYSPNHTQIKITSSIGNGSHEHWNK